MLLFLYIASYSDLSIICRQYISFVVESNRYYSRQLTTDNSGGSACLGKRMPLLCQIGTRVGVSSQDVRNVIIWGNHSSTQFPDVGHATVTVDGKDVPVPEAVKDDNWLKTDFIKVPCCFSVSIALQEY